MIQGAMLPNVPVVCGDFAVAIKERSAFPYRKTVVE